MRHWVLKKFTALVIRVQLCSVDIFENQNSVSQLHFQVHSLLQNVSYTEPLLKLEERAKTKQKLLVALFMRLLK